TGKNSDEMLTHLARDMRQHLVLALFKLHSKHCIRQRFEDFSHDFYRLFLRHTTVGHKIASAGKLCILTRGSSKCQAAEPKQLLPVLSSPRGSNGPGLRPPDPAQ